MTRMPLLFLLASVPAGVVGNVCEGMTFGDCTLEDDIIIEELPVDAETCRMICLLDDTCVFWRARMDAQLECTVMKSDYHKDCNSFAGPTAGSVEDCYNVDQATCDAIKQDECTYTGERLTSLEPPPNQIGTIQQCQTRAALVGAKHFHYIGVGSEECRLYATMEATCNVVGAAYQTPADCQLPGTGGDGTTTTAAATTTASAATTTGPLDVTITITTLNAINNVALPGVSVDFSLEDVTHDSVVTDENGQATIKPRMDLLPGSMLFSATLEGFYTETVEVEIASEPSDQAIGLSLNPTHTNTTDMRIVMNWGHLPEDLDLHVIQIDRTGASCQTFYGNPTGCPGLSLDVDNTHGGDEGAETVSWEEGGDFTYLMFVHDFSGDSTHLAQSGARVALYGQDSAGQEHVVRLEVPVKDGNEHSRWWLVGCMEGLLGVDSFNTLNQLVDTLPSTEACAAYTTTASP